MAVKKAQKAARKFAKKTSAKVKTLAAKAKKTAKKKAKAARKTIKRTAPRVTESAIVKKTGKTLMQWFSLLDEAGGRAMASTEVKKLLKAQHQVAGLASQAVAAAYKRAHNLKKLQKTAQDIGANVTKTLTNAVDKVEDLLKKAR